MKYLLRLSFVAWVIFGLSVLASAGSDDGIDTVLLNPAQEAEGAWMSFFRPEVPPRLERTAGSVGSDEPALWKYLARTPELLAYEGLSGDLVQTIRSFQITSNQTLTLVVEVAALERLAPEEFKMPGRRITVPGVPLGLALRGSRRAHLRRGVILPFAVAFTGSPENGILTLRREHPEFRALYHFLGEEGLMHERAYDYPGIREPIGIPAMITVRSATLTVDGYLRMQYDLRYSGRAGGSPQISKTHEFDYFGSGTRSPSFATDPERPQAFGALVAKIDAMLGPASPSCAQKLKRDAF